MSQGRREITGWKRVDARGWRERQRRVTALLKDYDETSGGKALLMRQAQRELAHTVTLVPKEADRAED